MQPMRQRGYLATAVVFCCMVVIAWSLPLAARVLVAASAAGALLVVIRWEAASDRHHQFALRVQGIAFRVYLAVLIAVVLGAIILLTFR